MQHATATAATEPYYITRPQRYRLRLFKHSKLSQPKRRRLNRSRHASGEKHAFRPLR